jgi:hypothetical protein
MIPDENQHECVADPELEDLADELDQFDFEGDQDLLQYNWINSILGKFVGDKFGNHK